MEPKMVCAAAGLDIGWLEQMEQKYGASVFGLIGELLNHGFSKDWIVEAVTRLHPILLDVFLHVFANPAAARAQSQVMGIGNFDFSKLGGLVDGIPADLVSGPLVIFMLEKTIPLLGSFLTGWQLWLAKAALTLLLQQLKAKQAAKQAA